MSSCSRCFLFVLVVLLSFVTACSKSRNYYNFEEEMGGDMLQNTDMEKAECTVDGDCRGLLNAKASCDKGACFYTCNDGWSDFGGVLSVDGCLCDKLKGSCLAQSVCGDGFKEGDEDCDDGDLNSDVCPYGSSTCQVCDLSCTIGTGNVLGYCGDGEIQEGWGEECDGDVSCLDVNKVYGNPYCSSDCKGDYTSCLSVVGLAKSDRKTCALFENGNVKCWGKGPLGNRSSSDSDYPVDVIGLYGDVQKVVTNKGYSCMLNGLGEVWCWGGIGEGSNVVLKVKIDEVVDISVGEGFACAVVSSGFVKCWGENREGGFLGHSDGFYSDPVLIQSVSQVMSISSGDGHSCVVLNDGSVRCWGAGNLGGQGSDDVIVNGVMDVKSVFVQNDSSCVLLDDGSVSCWGDNLGYFGDGSGFPSKIVYSTPRTISGLKGVSKISFGADHMCVLKGGEVLCAGQNDFGQLGDGTEEFRVFHVKVDGVVDAVDVSAGYKSTCVVLRSGPVKCWGYNVNGELGDGTKMTQLLPVDVRWQ